MKTIYLWVKEKGWMPFKYNELSDLTEELSNRNIIIGNWCKLGDGCKLGYRCELGDGCELGNWCELGDGCKLDDGCKLGDWCKLGYRCKLGDGCKLDDGCKLGNWCELGNGCNCQKSLFIHASRHTVTYWGCDSIQIGCKRYSISEWQHHFQKIGLAEDYTPEQIEEYKGYIDLIDKMHATWNIEKQ